MSNIIHLMSALQGNSFVFPRGSMFRFEEKNKINYFPRKQTLSVLLYSDEIQITKYSTIVFCDIKKLYKVNDFKI